MIDAPINVADSRFARLESIAWWDQAKLSALRVLVVGAGALGNELVKNLALLGVGHVAIVDRDAIELSNLSRSVLFRETDIGRDKATVAAESARRIFPAIRATPVVTDAIDGVGAGLYRWAHVILGGLDNRETRLHLNRQARRFDKPWIDGAIEQIQGVARLFLPAADQPCYECTLGERDFQLIAQRRSCAMLTRRQMELGHTPTTPTIASIIAAIQVQEAVKLAHGQPTLAGEGVTFVGQTPEMFRVAYQRRDDCLAHDPPLSVIELDVSSDALTARELLDEARRVLGEAATLDLGRDVVASIACGACGQAREVFKPIGLAAASRCECGSDAAGEVTTFDRIAGDEAFLDRTLAALGVPPFDVIAARAGDRAIAFEITGDRGRVFGEPSAAEVAWS